MILAPPEKNKIFSFLFCFFFFFFFSILVLFNVPTLLGSGEVPLK